MVPNATSVSVRDDCRLAVGDRIGGAIVLSGRNNRFRARCISRETRELWPKHVLCARYIGRPRPSVEVAYSGLGAPGEHHLIPCTETVLKRFEWSNPMLGDGFSFFLTSLMCLALVALEDAHKLANHKECDGIVLSREVRDCGRRGMRG